MGLILDFKNYLDGVQSDHAALISSVKVVTDPKQVNLFLRDHDDSGLLMVAVLPRFGNNGATGGDDFRNRGFTEVMLLEKTDYSELDNDAFLEQSDRIFDLAYQIQQRLLDDMESGECYFLRHIVPNSMQLVDVYNLTQFNGWNILFAFDVE